MVFGIGNDNRVKTRFLSLGLTCLVILLVLFASSATAIKVNLKTDRQVYNNNTRYVVFTSSIDIQKDEIVPISSLRLIINKDFKVCTFDAAGSSSSCPFVTIRPLFLVPGQDANLYGKGFGSNDSEKPSSKATDFGFGYGYGEMPHRQGMNGEMLYEIKWDILSDDVPNGKYEVVLEALAQNGAKQFIYKTTAPTVFHVKILPNAKGDVKCETFFDNYEGAIVRLNNYTSFTVEDTSMSTDLRKVLDEGTTKVEGKVSVTAYAETPSADKLTFAAEFTDYKITTFDDNNVVLTGHIKYSLKVNNNKGKQIQNKVGEEIGSITIDSNQAIIKSTDKLPFEIIENGDFGISCVEEDDD